MTGKALGFDFESSERVNKTHSIGSSISDTQFNCNQQSRAESLERDLVVSNAM